MKPFSFSILLLLSALGLCIGCQSRLQNDPLTPTAGLSDPIQMDELVARPTPPLGWLPDPLKKSDDHTHQVWISPSGNTAYGIINFSLPLPFSPDFVLPHFIEEMREDQGDAELISHEPDPKLPGVRFLCEGGLYRMRVNLLTSGFQGWAIYAGTLRDQPINDEELHLAERARENTRVGK